MIPYHYFYKNNKILPQIRKTNLEGIRHKKLSFVLKFIAKTRNFYSFHFFPLFVRRFGREFFRRSNVLSLTSFGTDNLDLLSNSPDLRSLTNTEKKREGKKNTLYHLMNLSTKNPISKLKIEVELRIISSL